MLKAASIILIIVALFSVILGIVYVTRGTLMGYHEEFLSMTMEDIREFNPNLASLATIFIRLAGALLISVGILVIAVVFYGLRKAERWAWWATLMGMGLAIAPMVVITRPVGGFPWASAIVLLAVFVIGIGLAAKEIFSKETEGRITSI